MKICIENKDRHGLVYDISKILLKYNVNIISMEVIKNTTYLETEALSYKGEQKILSELIIWYCSNKIHYANAS